MEQHLIEDAVWQRMLAALETVPYMHGRDLDRLRCFISACFVVMRTNLTWAELGGLVPSAEAAKKRFRRWAKRGVFDRLMECSQPVAAPDVLHIGRTCCTLIVPGAFASETQASSATARRPALAAAGTNASGVAAAG